MEPKNTNETIIEKIKKILALSKNNPSEEEAKAAALTAQKLLAKYHLSMAEVEELNTETLDEITECSVTVGGGRKWKYTLAHIIADNFRCRHFYYGKGTVVFYGHSTDATVASETFKYLFKFGHRKADAFVHKVFKDTGSVTGVYNSYVSGFCKGLREALAEQCTALALVVPEDVKQSYAELIKNSKTLSNTSVQIGYNQSCVDAFNDGRHQGKEVMSKKKLSAN